MSRFGKVNKSKELKFDYALYDAVVLDDNRTALITGFGIYDNQYWCEICYPDKVCLGAADYFSSDPQFYGTKIVKKLSSKDKKLIIKKYIKALRRYPELYSKHILEMESLIV